MLPLYPQYSRSTTETVRDLLAAGAGPKSRWSKAFTTILATSPRSPRACSATGRRTGRGDKLVMSFHGLPKRAVEQGDPYQAQCTVTATLLAGALRLEETDWMLTFQSRFGAAEWLQPYTEPTLRRLAQAGARRVDVVCPGFVSDCLETLEEIAIEGRRAFLEAGGSEFHALPCLNEAPEWIEALAKIVETAP